MRRIDFFKTWSRESYSTWFYPTYKLISSDFHIFPQYHRTNSIWFNSYFFFNLGLSNPIQSHPIRLQHFAVESQFHLFPLKTWRRGKPTKDPNGGWTDPPWLFWNPKPIWPIAIQKDQKRQDILYDEDKYVYIYNYILYYIYILYMIRYIFLQCGLKTQWLRVELPILPEYIGARIAPGTGLQERPLEHPWRFQSRGDSKADSVAILGNRDLSRSGWGRPALDQ